MAKGPKEIKVGADGYYLDPNTDTAPQGALLAAHNVVYTKTGGVRPRGAFTAQTASSNLQADLEDAVIAGGGDSEQIGDTRKGAGFVAYLPAADKYFVVGEGGATNLATAGNSNSTWSDSKDNPVEDFGVEHIGATAQRWVAFQDKIFYMTDIGLKFYDTTDKFGRAGVPWHRGTRNFDDAADSNPHISMSVSSVSGLSWLAPGDTVAYRVVFGYKDGKGTIHLGPPSNRIEVTNDEADARHVIIDALPSITPEFTGTGGVNYFVQIYRTESVTGTPDEEYRLVFEEELVANTTGVVDVVPDAARGAFLYTNPSQGGSLAAKNSPPVSNDLAVFNNRLFFAKKCDHQSTIISIDRAVKVTGNAGGSAPTTDESFLDSFFFGVSSNTATGGVFGTAAFTAAFHPSDNTKIRLTQYAPHTTTWADVELAVNYAVDGPNIAPGSYITEVTVVGGSDYDVTLSTAHTGTASAATTIDISSCILLKRASGSLYAYRVNNSSVIDTDSTYAGSDELKQLTQSLCFAINNDSATPGSPGKYEALYIGSDEEPGKFLLRSTSKLGKTNFSSTERCVPPQAFSGYSEESGTPAWTSTYEEANALYFSELNEPAAVPFTNVIYVGSSTDAILRLAAAGTSLFIFKTDGIFVLRGTGPQDFYVRQLYTDIILTDPNSPAIGHGVVYALTNKGFLAISESGISPIGDPLFEYGRVTEISLDSYGAVYFPRLNAYIVLYDGTKTAYDPSIYDPGSAPGSRKGLVYYTDQRKWATWDFPDYTNRLLVTPAIHPRYSYSSSAVDEEWHNLFAITSPQDPSTGTLQAYYYDESSYADSAVYWQQFVGDDLGAAKHFDAITLSFSENELSSAIVRTFGDFVYNAGLSSQSQSFTSPGDKRFLTTLVPREHRVGTRLAVGIETSGFYSCDQLNVSYWPLKGFIRR